MLIKAGQVLLMVPKILLKTAAAYCGDVKNKKIAYIRLIFQVLLVNMVPVQRKTMAIVFAFVRKDGKENHVNIVYHIGNAQTKM